MPRPRPAARPTACLALAVGLATAGCSGSDSTYHGPSSGDSLVSSLVGSIDLGETLFEVFRGRLAAAPSTPPAKLAALDARRDDFIAAVNAILDADSLTHLGPTLRAILDLVDDGTLPHMAENVAQILERILAEPDQRTLRGILALASARTVVQAEDGLEFFARAVNYPESENTVVALAEIMRLNDGVDEQGQPNGEPDLVTEVLGLASRSLRTFSQGAGPSTAALQGLTDGLLEHAPPRGGATLGAPAWVVLADRHGNPRVRTDPVTGRLLAPFVDLDGDGAADVDADGEPVDALGQPIAIPPFDIAGAAGRDALGRALAPSGQLYYEYRNAKETLLAHLLMLGGEALRRGMHIEAADVLEIALGARVPNDAGTPADPGDDFLGFAPDGPVVGLIWGLLETWRPDDIPAIQRAIAEIGRSEPALAEEVLVTLGRALEQLRPVVLTPSAGPPTAADRQRADRLLALLDRVFDAPSSASGRSTARTLADVLHRLGLHARNLPGQLALLARYRVLDLDAAGNPGPGSLLVDRSRPATVGGAGQVENRSCLQQVLDLLAHTDGCATFGLFGKPLSETILNLMAGRTVGQVSSLIDLLQSAVVRGLIGVVCPGIDPHLDALEALRDSGALNAFVPIAEVFVDQGETRLLLDLLVEVQQAYASLRPHEEALADVLASGAFDPLIDLLDLLVVGRGGSPIADPVTGERALDLFFDGLAELLDHPAGGVADRLGRPQPSRLHLLIEPCRRITDRLFASSSGSTNGADILTALAYNATDLLIERVTNDAGTPNDPGDDYEQLLNPSLVPFVVRGFDVLDGCLPVDRQARVLELERWQRLAEEALTSRDAAALVDLVHTLRHASGAATLRLAAIDLLTPDPVAQDDVLGSLLKLLASGLQAHVDIAPVRDLAAFLADVLEPGRQQVTELVYGLNQLIQADQGRVLIALIRNALNDAAPDTGLPANISPAEVLLDILRELDAAGAQSGASELTQLRELVTELVAFIRDDRQGLERVFDLIRAR